MLHVASTRSDQAPGMGVPDRDRIIVADDRLDIVLVQPIRSLGIAAAIGELDDALAPNQQAAGLLRAPQTPQAIDLRQIGIR